MWPLALAADAAGLQIVVGAVGDQANRTALDLAEHLLEREGPRDRRFRVAHAQHLHPPDIARFATQRTLASLLPFSALHDGRWIDQQLGPQRGRTSFAVRGLLDAGAHVSFGSGRLHQGSPIDGIYAAVTRRTLDGLHPQGWLPEQRVTVEEALRAYTTGAAYAGFDETRVGALRVGHLADFVMVDRDLLTVAPTDIPTVRVVLTVVGGEIVLDRLRQTGL
jgi:predicted amidohydrolase YtcJ